LRGQQNQRCPKAWGVGKCIGGCNLLNQWSPMQSLGYCKLNLGKIRAKCWRDGDFTH
jgi:hypothetical protein